jgi:hypothetical protein
MLLYFDLMDGIGIDGASWLNLALKRKSRWRIASRGLSCFFHMQKTTLSGRVVSQATTVCTLPRLPVSPSSVTQETSCLLECRVEYCCSLPRKRWCVPLAFPLARPRAYHFRDGLQPWRFCLRQLLRQHFSGTPSFPTSYSVPYILVERIVRLHRVPLFYPLWSQVTPTTLRQ